MYKLLLFKIHLNNFFYYYFVILQSLIILLYWHILKHKHLIIISTVESYKKNVLLKIK